MFNTPTDPKTDEHPRPPLFLGGAIPSFLPSEEGRGSGRGKRDVIEIRFSLPVMYLDYFLSSISICFQFIWCPPMFRGKPYGRG